MELMTRARDTSSPQRLASSIATASALITGARPTTAHAAAEIACHAAPYDEIARLDLAKILEAEGHEVLAEELLRDEVFNRSDDYLPPIDLPKRTEQVVENHD